MCFVRVRLASDLLHACSLTFYVFSLRNGLMIWEKKNSAFRLPERGRFGLNPGNGSARLLETMRNQQSCLASDSNDFSSWQHFEHAFSRWNMKAFLSLERTE